MEAGPLGVGLATACWPAVLLRVLLWRECGVLDHRPDVCPWLPPLGFALPKARVVSDHLDAAQRLAWLEEKWPAILRAAQPRQGLLLFAEEARLAPWGSWSAPGARRGRQPEVLPSGKRQGSRVFGAMAYGSGRLFSQGSEGRCPAAKAQAFVERLLEPTPAHLFLLPDGARDHTSAATQAFGAAQSERSTVPPLPSYSPDDTPMASRWRKTKKRATHHKSCQEFAALTVSVDKALAYFATHAETV
jgi:hypothetical protein